MINKHTYIFCFFLCVALTGCHRSSMPVDRNNIREWLSQDADSCLWYYAGHYTTLLKEKRYQEIEQLYASVLRAMPEHPKGGKNMNYLMGWVLAYYYNALMYQPPLLCPGASPGIACPFLQVLSGSEPDEAGRQYRTPLSFPSPYGRSTEGCPDMAYYGIFSGVLQY